MSEFKAWARKAKNVKIRTLQEDDIAVPPPDEVTDAVLTTLRAVDLSSSKPRGDRISLPVCCLLALFLTYEIGESKSSFLLSDLIVQEN